MSHFCIRVERLRGPARYHGEGAWEEGGSDRKLSSVGGTREASEAVEGGAAPQSGWFLPQSQVARGNLRRHHHHRPIIPQYLPKAIPMGCKSLLL